MGKVVVLGGGACGLSAAWELSRNGMNVVVIEAEHLLGGLCKTVNYKGFNFDLGGHRLISKNSGLLHKISSIMGNELLVSERVSAIRLNGKDFKYPLSASDILQQTSVSFAARCFMDYVFQSMYMKVKQSSDCSLEDWIIHRFGKTLYNNFFRDYTNKLWGISSDNISSDWAAERISLLDLWDVALRLFGLKKSTPRTYTKNFFYPKSGIGQIFKCIAEEIKKNHGTIILNAIFKRFHIAGDHVTGIIYTINGREEMVLCDWVISTIPITDLFHSISQMQNKDFGESLKALRYRSLRFLNILIDKPDIGNNTWIYVPEAKYIMTRIQEPKRRSPHNAPDGKTSLILEIPCFYNDEIWEMADNQLYSKCIEDLLKLGIDIKSQVIDYFFTSAKHAYPIYQLDYRIHLDKLVSCIGRLKNVSICGRNGLFKYIFMDEAMEMGFAAAMVVGKKRTEKT